MTNWYPKVATVIDNGFGGSRHGRAINGVVIHHVAGTNGLAYVANANPRNSHPTYHIAKSGAVTGIVHPDRRPYSTGGTPDPNAVTFEIDNSSTGGTWPITDQSLDALIDVIVYHASQSPRAGRGFALNDPNRVQAEFFIAWHSQYKATACPGGYVTSKLDYIVSECNKRASGKPSTPSRPITPPAPTAPSKPRLGKWLRNGSTGDNVRYLQRALGGLKVDGVFGPITQAAVRKFQKAQKITIDGIVGPQTWSRLP